MATPESYRPEESGSSPAPPTLPERGPERFQFSLKQLLAFMLASALIAAGLRHVVAYVQLLPFEEQTSLVNVTLGGLVLGGLLYFFLRAPFLVVKAGRFRRRWQEIKRHRQELAAWGNARKQEAKAKNADVPPPT